MIINKRINTAIIGFGLSGSIFHAPFLSSSPAFNLIAVVSSNLLKVQSQLPLVKVFATMETMLANVDVDLVIIATPNHTHYEFAKIALNYHKHVVVEKPFVLAVNQAEELIQLALNKQRILCTYQNRRWDGSILKLKTLFEEGIFGNIYQCNFHFDRYRPQVKKTKWKEFNIEGSGSLYDLGPHLIDHALCFFGWPDTVQADMAIQRKGAQAIDYFHLVLTYNKIKVILHSSSVILGDVPHLQVHGDNANFIYYGIDPQEARLINLINKTISLEKELNHGMLRIYKNGQIKDRELIIEVGDYQQFYNQLSAAINGQVEPPVSSADMLNNVKLIDFALKSFTLGKKLAINT